ncbi:uncharacterized protein LOC128550286 [Mercenaria mercenaria]|uniref:uncharacterized protein LOC128550286 n=1 Tax=Mercenaria mercenaria TaxID=6596 RepID=UPI00234F9063|nr:uncharacterized protein LOC128550286 [Mercenaria mercenaria]
MSIAKGCVFCIAMVAGWLISYSFGIEDALLSNSETQDWVSQNEQDDSYSAAISQDRQRVARAISDPRRNCNTWAEWVNENHPSLPHKEDKEFISQRTRQEFCPSGKISKFECKDDKGEPFQRNFTSLDGTFFISCYDINVGVICTISNTSSAYIKHCPDMSIRYYCSCPALHTDHTISGKFVCFNLFIFNYSIYGIFTTDLPFS